MLERYKARCEARKESSYDPFRKSRDHDDCDANVMTLGSGWTPR